MSASSTRRLPHYRSSVLGALLCLAAALASAEQEVPLTQRLADLSEMNRFVPERGLPQLLKLEPEARAAGDAALAEYLDQLGIAESTLGKLSEADAVADQLIALGRKHHYDIALIKGLMVKRDVLLTKNELAESHRLAWEAEKLARDSSDRGLRVRTMIASGNAYADEGNFPMALDRLQAAASLAIEHGQPIPIVSALNALANQYNALHEHEKGFAALAEATAAAEQANSPGRMAGLKMTEFALAIDSGQTKRALNALQAALAGQRKIGARSEIARTLGNLADCYLKLHEYDLAIDHAKQAYEQGRVLKDPVTMAVALVNMGQGYIAKGRVAEGKRNADEGLKMIEESGNKPMLQAGLMEYGEILEAAGDTAAAVKAYHRERDLSNELFEKRRQKATLELQAKYEADKKQQQIQLLRRENEIKSAELDNRRLQQRVWWLLMLVFALSSVIVGILYRKVRSANAKLEEKNLELKQQSVRDPLTGLYNRRHFQEYMRTYQGSDKRGAGTTGDEMVGALFLLDVDQFKHINDSCGHAVGDTVLKGIADNLREILRETDMIVRWGGEEFLAFLPAIPRSGLDEVARRLLTGISASVIEFQGKPLSANVSIGYSPYPLAPNGKPLNWERAVNLVDMALYLAKAHGRNRAYGVRGFPNGDSTPIEQIEQDLEQAWRDGHVDLTIVLGGWPELREAV
jgi:diguanylate cyclase (GGDEF)-like protein